MFTEKPIVTTIEESFELARLLNQYGQDRLMVGLVLRYSPLYRDLRQAQAQGLLGDIASIEASEHIAPIMARSSCATGAVTTSMLAVSCWKSAATTSTFITA